MFKRLGKILVKNAIDQENGLSIKRKHQSLKKFRKIKPRIPGKLKNTNTKHMN